MQKFVYLYNDIDSFKRSDQMSLPACEHFVIVLTELSVWDVEYFYAWDWMLFNMCTFADYHEVYLLSDVLLLVDVLESQIHCLPR